MQAFHFRHRNIGAGRVVGIGEEDDAGLARDTGQHAVDIGGEVAFARHHRSRAVGGNGDRIDEKAEFRIDRFVALTKIGMRQELQDLVRTRSADDIRGLESVTTGDCLAQFMRGAVRIEFEHFGGTAIGFHRGRARAQRAFIGRQLVDLLALGSGPARHVGRNVENARLRNRPSDSGCGGHR